MKRLSNILKIIIAAVMVVVLLPIGNSVNASTVDITGNTSDDAIVIDSSGQEIDPSNTSKWNSYDVRWNFTIPNDAKINSGDTAIFTLPDGMTANGNLNFEVKNQSGDVIGNFVINQDQNTGTLMFNDYYQTHHQVNRHGSIWISANGVKDQQAGQNDWNVNKVSWVDNNEPVWNIAINAGVGYDHFVLDDTADSSQTIIKSSIQAQQGYYDDNGKFVAEKDLPIDATVDGNHMTLSFENIQGIVNITYQTTSDKKGTLSNKVTAITHTGAQEHETNSTNWSDSAELTYDGGGNATGECSSSSSSSKTESSSTSSSNVEESSIESSSSTPSSDVESSSSVSSSEVSSVISSSSVSSSHGLSSISSTSSETESSSIKSSESSTKSSSKIESRKSSSSMVSISSNEQSSRSSNALNSNHVMNSVKSSNSHGSLNTTISDNSLNISSSHLNGAVTNNNSSNQKSGNGNGKGTGTGLPQTGETLSITLTIIGFALLMVAIVIIFKNKKH